jgi:hypothetical protein
MCVCVCVCVCDHNHNDVTTANSRGDVGQDLEAAMEDVRRDPGLSKLGSAPIYGMSAISPDRGIIGDFLEAYQDVLLSG